MLKITLFTAISVITFIATAQTGTLKVVSSGVQVGYNNYKWLGFGYNPSAPLSGQSQWSIEHWSGGLNFCKPWPSNNVGNYKMFLSDDGFVGINMKPIPNATSNTTAAGVYQKATVGNFRLQVTGNVISHGFYLWSDAKIKNNVEDLESCLPKIMALKPHKYNYMTEKSFGGSIATSDTDATKNATIQADLSTPNVTNEAKHYGFFAQEVVTQFPNLTSNIGDIGVVNYLELVPILIKGMQEQQSQIENLKKEIANWKGKPNEAAETITKLFQNNPNPFRGTTEISYIIDEKTPFSSATIEVRDILGKLKSTMSIADKNGSNKVLFDGSNLADGYYIYTIKIDNSVRDSKLFLKGD